MPEVQMAAYRIDVYPLRAAANYVFEYVGNRIQVQVSQVAGSRTAPTCSASARTAQGQHRLPGGRTGALNCCVAGYLSRRKIFTTSQSIPSFLSLYRSARKVMPSAAAVLVLL